MYIFCHSLDKSVYSWFSRYGDELKAYYNGLILEQIGNWGLMIGSGIEAVSATLSGAVLRAIPGLYGIFSGMIKIEEEKLDLELWHKITHLA